MESSSCVAPPRVKNMDDNYVSNSCLFAGFLLFGVCAFLVCTRCNSLQLVGGVSRGASPSPSALPPNSFRNADAIGRVQEQVAHQLDEVLHQDDLVLNFALLWPCRERSSSIAPVQFNKPRPG